MSVKDVNIVQGERKNVKENASLERRRQHVAIALTTVRISKLS